MIFRYWNYFQPISTCLLDGLCVSVLLIGRGFADGRQARTSALTLMLYLLTTCLNLRHQLWCGCSACGKRKAVHGGLVAIGLAWRGRGGMLANIWRPLWTTLILIRTSFRPPTHTSLISLPRLSFHQFFFCFLLTDLITRLSPLFHRGHQISHVINRKRERGNLMSRKAKRQTFYCCLRTKLQIHQFN